MKIIRNNILPFGKKYAAINLFGVFFVKKNVLLTTELINHERIHTRQQTELLFVFFYIIYVIEWFYRLLQHGFNGHRSYLAISFEREAYAHGNDLDYLKHRRHYAQWRK